MLVTDSEGVRYPKPKLKIIGLESKRSSTPKWSKENLEIAYRYTLEDKPDEVYNLRDEIYKKVMLMDVSDLGVPTSISSISDQHVYSECDDDLYWGFPESDNNVYSNVAKGTPMHVKAAMNHNTLVADKKLQHIDPITPGNKIKVLKLKVPNPYNMKEIAFVTYLPEEFGLHKYVDREAVFKKGFEQPLQNFLDSVGWKTEETVTLF